MTGYDIVTTYSKVSNRSIFLLNDNDTFKQESYNRKGCMCNEEKMADGAIYKMKNNYLFDLMQHEDVNHTFWHSKIKFIENTTPLFLDVDTPQDLEVFKMITLDYPFVPQDKGLVLRDEFIASVPERILDGTYWIGKKRTKLTENIKKWVIYIKYIN